MCFLTNRASQLSFIRCLFLFMKMSRSAFSGRSRFLKSVHTKPNSVIFFMIIGRISGRISGIRPAGYPAGYPVPVTGYPAGYRIAKKAGYPVQP